MNGKYKCVVFELQLFCAKQLVMPPLSSAACSSFYPQTDCLGTMVHVTLDWKLTSEKDICHPKHQASQTQKKAPVVTEPSCGRGKTNTFEENIFYHPALHCSNCDVSMWCTAGRDWSNLATDPSSQLQFLVRCAAWFLIHWQRTQSILFRWHSSSIYWTLNAFSFLQPLLNLMIWGHIAHQVFKRIT